MPNATAAELLARNRDHVEQLSDDYFDDVLDGQSPPVVSLCCADSRVSQEAMWSVEGPGWLFTPANIGNVAWDAEDPSTVDGNLLYPVANTDTRTIAVVGHTGCGAVTAAYGAATDGALPDEPGIRKRVEPLVPIVEDALDSGVTDDEDVVDRLVEYNVREQVAFLDASDEIPDDTLVLGFVYDFHETYGDAPGRTYLVAADGETDPAALRGRIDDDDEIAVRSLL
ncbi:carbonic anhydrase [Halococcus qingdaonensis]|uniref:carbonic anhydrase n=1 Tax=Halococcus qingdaonensis TaxID=224402 RepID=UPI0021170FF4|nr:carbonic anhydrase [Halococcus qingdaonensis]